MKKLEIQKIEKKEENNLKKNKFSSLTEYFEEQKKNRLENARKIKESWELMSLCVSYIEENAEIWIVNIREREGEERKKQELWDKEEKRREKRR